MDIELLGDVETAWRGWTLQEATGWRFLPCPGGILDQEEALLMDILAIAALNERWKRSQNA